MKIKKIGVLAEIDGFLHISGTLDPNLGMAVSCQDESIHPEYCNVGVDFGDGKQLPIPALIPARALVVSSCVPASIFTSGQFEMVSGRYVNLYLYQSCLFEVEVNSLADASEELAILLIKKHLLTEAQRLQHLRRDVEALEAIHQGHLAKRSAIPAAIRMLVWERDDGQCVACSSRVGLQFDHIIPVSKGGGNSAENLQILCERCNLRKSDRIGG